MPVIGVGSVVVANARVHDEERCAARETVCRVDAAAKRHRVPDIEAAIVKLG